MHECSVFRCSLQTFSSHELSLREFNWRIWIIFIVFPSGTAREHSAGCGIKHNSRFRYTPLPLLMWRPCQRWNGNQRTYIVSERIKRIIKKFNFHRRTPTPFIHIRDTKYRRRAIKHFSIAQQTATIDYLSCKYNLQRQTALHRLKILSNVQLYILARKVINFHFNVFPIFALTLSAEDFLIAWVWLCAPYLAWLCIWLALTLCVILLYPVWLRDRAAFDLTWFTSPTYPTIHDNCFILIFRTSIYLKLFVIPLIVYHILYNFSFYFRLLNENEWNGQETV